MIFNTYVIKHSNILLFADDTKLFKKINWLHDFITLQEDLNNFTKLCYLNGLCINIDKCKILKFYLKNSSIKFDYMLNNISIESVK